MRLATCSYPLYVKNKIRNTTFTTALSLPYYYRWQPLGKLQANIYEGECFPAARVFQIFWEVLFLINQKIGEYPNYYSFKFNITRHVCSFMLKLHVSMPVSERLSRISSGKPVFLSKTTVHGEKEIILWYKQKVSQNNCCFAIKFIILI